MPNEAGKSSCLGAAQSWLLTLLSSFLLALPLSLAAGETYMEATVDTDGQLHIVTADHRDIIPQKEEDQVGFGEPVISDDKTTVGWLELYPYGSTSYPIPLALVIYRNGKVLRTFVGGSSPFPIWKWRFEADGKQVAFAQETIHGHQGVHFELRDIKSGRLIAEHDGDPEPVSPKWIRDIADQ